MLVVLGESSSDAALEQGLELVEEYGGFLTVAAIAGKPWPNFNCGPLVAPVVSAEELLAAAEARLARVHARVPDYVSLKTLVLKGDPLEAILSRISIAAHDVVVMRSGRSRMRKRLVERSPVPVLGGDAVGSSQRGLFQGAKPHAAEFPLVRP